MTDVLALDAVGQAIDLDAEELGHSREVLRRFGNMSSATVPVALVEALETGRVAPHSLLLTPGFGAGLTWAAHVIRWGSRVTPIATADIDLPPCDKTAVEVVQDIIRRKGSVTHGFDAQFPMRKAKEF